MRFQLTGKELANIVRAQPRYIDCAILELLSQQHARDVKAILARTSRQPSYVAQMFIVTA